MKRAFLNKCSKNVLHYATLLPKIIMSPIKYHIYVFKSFEMEYLKLKQYVKYKSLLDLFFSSAVLEM